MRPTIRIQDALVVLGCGIVGWAIESRALAEQSFFGYAAALAVCGMFAGYVTRSRLFGPLGLWVGQIVVLLAHRPPMWGVTWAIVTASISISVLAAFAGVALRRAVGKTHL